MSTYAISDVHGCLRQLKELLSIISPSDDDTVFIMGDIVDRGPESAEAVKWAIDEAPNNIEFMLGNHELMMRQDADTALEDGKDDIEILRGGIWDWNGGEMTLWDLEEITDRDWRVYKLVPWLHELSPWRLLEINKKPTMLVHAGFDTTELFGKPSYHDVWMTGERFHDVPLGLGNQDEMVMTWVRHGWYDSEEEMPFEVICGHTPIPLLSREAKMTVEYNRIRHNTKKSWADTVPDDARIWRYANRIDIDCGCAYRGHLAALRLEDGEEFYVDGPERDEEGFWKI